MGQRQHKEWAKDTVSIIHERYLSAQPYFTMTTTKTTIIIIITKLYPILINLKNRGSSLFLLVKIFIDL
jgi:hypothetical protein